MPLESVAAGSDEAGQRFPGIDPTAAYREITVVADSGQVWTGHHAFVVCLWALSEYRPLSHRLSTPAGLPLARGAALAAAKYRAATASVRAGASPRQGWGGDAWDGRVRPMRAMQGPSSPSRRAGGRQASFGRMYALANHVPT
ncbi:DUF393 domain-containing protein [Wenjunlia tyrosinilytica]|uniref:Uncharacterized protein n=1 Tax=Wenjunlia tyrosinilytica TaxID=1544741 RepID=A0A917ZP97_9ACTN|nr:DUF393 domain-containing protein [Wenjunlia tyrosinilytica]GGO88603.1 hypothetical protein GCM10012280_29820 [Wenjunlia tyrosinilytica]